MNGEERYRWLVKNSNLYSAIASQVPGDILQLNGLECVCLWIAVKATI